RSPADLPVDWNADWPRYSCVRFTMYVVHRNLCSCRTQVAEEGTTLAMGAFVEGERELILRFLKVADDLFGRIQQGWGKVDFNGGVRSQEMQESAIGGAASHALQCHGIQT